MNEGEDTFELLQAVRPEAAILSPSRPDREPSRLSAFLWVSGNAQIVKSALDSINL